MIDLDVAWKVVKDTIGQLEQRMKEAEIDPTDHHGVMLATLTSSIEELQGLQQKMAQTDRTKPVPLSLAVAMGSAFMKIAATSTWLLADLTDVDTSPMRN